MTEILLFIPVLAVLAILIVAACENCTPPRKERDKDLFNKGV